MHRCVRTNHPLPVSLCIQDGRTPLHIAAAEGNGVIVKVLVEEGGARLDMRDRWVGAKFTLAMYKVHACAGGGVHNVPLFSHAPGLSTL